MPADANREAALLRDIVRRAALPELAHIDNFPGARMYVRDADDIARLLPPGTRVFDWGCGAGHMSWLLRRRGFNVVAADLLPTAPVPALIEGVEYLQLTDPVRLPLADAAVDAVVSSGTLEHVYSINRSMDEVRRILVPGGHFLVFRFPNERSISEWVARVSGQWSHAVRMSPRELRMLLRIYSFRVDHLGYDSFLPIFLGRRFSALRPLRERLDGAVHSLDQILVSAPVIRTFSTSIQVFARVNDEYRDLR